MSYCLNPKCSLPENSDNVDYCTKCGSKLILKNRYRALKLLGQGSFGRVFRAVDQSNPSEPDCVIKQFNCENSQIVDKALDLFREEAKQLEKLGKHKNPQIPKLLAAFTQNSLYYIVQEFIDGQNLDQELKVKDRFFNEAEIKEILLSLLPVLELIHDSQIIHRDIKPENIMRRRVDQTKGDVELGGDLVLIDFGAVKVDTGTSLSRPPTRIGTPDYNAPEQISGKVTYASDIYGLGTTCLNLLTQQSPNDTLYVYPDWVWRDFLGGNLVSPKIGKILDKMVARELSNRYQSAKEVLKDLNRKPQVLISKARIELKATKDDKLLTEPIPITNLIPDTDLEGEWSVAPHPSDPPHSPDSHAWITFLPKVFKGNEVTCQIEVDVRNLTAEASFDRTIILITNADPVEHYLNLRVTTAPMSLVFVRFPYFVLVSQVGLSIGFTLFAIALTFGWGSVVASVVKGVAATISTNWSNLISISSSIGTFAAFLMGFISVFKDLDFSVSLFLVSISFLGMSFISIGVFWLFASVAVAVAPYVVWAIFWLLCGAGLLAVGCAEVAIIHSLEDAYSKLPKKERYNLHSAG